MAYGPISKLEKKAYNQIISPILLGEIVRNNQETGSYAVF
jgi:hypothetical protein